MNTSVKVLKCPACGSSAIENTSHTTAKCSYCGSVLQMNGNHASIQKSQDKSNRRTIIFSTIGLLVIVFGKIAYQHYRDKPVINIPKQSIQTPKAIVPQIDIKSNLPTISTKAIKITENDIKQSQVTPQVDIVDTTEGATSAGGRFWIFTVKNNGQNLVARPGALVSVFDLNGKRLEEQKGWSKIEHLQPQQQTEVLVFISKPPKQKYNVEISAFAQNPGMYDVPQESLEVSDFTVKTKDERLLRADIIGEVKNTKDYQLDYVTVIALAKNQSDKTIGIANAFVSTTHIKPGGSSGFKVTAGTFVTQKPSKWSVFAIGKKHKNLINNDQ